MSACCSVSRTPAKNVAACSTVMLETWQMFWPSILTCRASARSRMPWQAEHTEYPAIPAEKHAHMQLVFLALQVGEEPADASETPLSVDESALLLRLEAQSKGRSSGMSGLTGKSSSVR